MALVAAAKAADYPAEIVGVISDKADAGGLAKADAEGISTFAFPRKDYASKDAHEAAIFSALDELKPDILCLAGYMRLLTATFIQRYQGRMLNIHPSLLPLFPGLHTHQRAIDAGMRLVWPKPLGDQHAGFHFGGDAGVDAQIAAAVANANEIAMRR